MSPVSISEPRLKGSNSHFALCLPGCLSSQRRRQCRRYNDLRVQLSNPFYMPCIVTFESCTVLVLRMAHRKWKETKQQPSMLPSCAWLLLSFFLYPVGHPEHEHCTRVSICFFWDNLVCKLLFGPFFLGNPSNLIYHLGLCLKVGSCVKH